MPAQEELTCVSCGSAFDPGPNGGFCPDCDTPHPDYEMRDEVEGDGRAAEGDEESAETGEHASESDEPLSESGDEESASEEIGDDEGMVEDDEKTAEGESDELEDDELDAEGEDEEIEDDEGIAESESDELEEPSVSDDEGGPEQDGEPESGIADSEAEESSECPSCGTSVDASASFCPNCGTNLEADTEPDSGELAACPNCNNSVSDESYCPNCGTDLDAIREADGEADAVEAGDEAPQGVTLVVAGESYRLGDGDTFGRQDQEWLDDLVTASGGRDEAAYISGEHLEFEVEDDGVYLTDRSTNGTSHNGEPMDGGRVKLEDGDMLELAGRAEIEVKL